jgi:hypothetical protein
MSYPLVVLYVGESSVSRKAFLNFVVLLPPPPEGVQELVAQWVKCVENKGGCMEKMLLYRLK